MGSNRKPVTAQVSQIKRSAIIVWDLVGHKVKPGVRTQVHIRVEDFIFDQERQIKGLIIIG